MSLDPGEYDIAELGPAIKDVDDLDELEEILQKEKSGEDRQGAVTLIQSRIDKFEDEDGDEDGEVDVTEMTVADIGNAIRDIDEVERLQELLDQEEGGEDRKSAKNLIQKRIDNLSDDEGEEEEAVEAQSPEERHPDLDHPTADKRHVRAIEDGTYGDMWVYCETQHGELIDVSREMLGKARELMDGYNDDYDEDEQVVAVLIGDDVERLADECIALGADVVVVNEGEELERFRHKPFTEIFCDMARWGGDPGEGNPDEADWRDYDEPRYVIFPATNNGRDLSAMVQAELDSGLASDCSDLYITEAEISNPVKTGKPGTTKTFERILHMPRPDFSGFEYSTILCLDNPHREFHPQGGSVIPGSFEVPEADPEREGQVVEHDLEMPDDWFQVEVTEHDTLDSGVDLTGYDVVVAMGRGIGDDPTRGIELGLDLVDAFDDAELGLSRGVITSSYGFEGHVEQYIGEDRQIGESGQVVEPKVYIAAGISGAIQHKVGMDDSDVIIAINTDPEADIRDFSDYVIEGDLFDVLPALTEAVEAGELDLDAVAAAGGASDD